MSEKRGDGQELRLGRWSEVVEARLRRWEAEDFGRRLWAKDHTLWSPEPVPELTDRLGWLELPDTMPSQIDELERFAAGVRDEGFQEAVVLGMGGSSLAPEVFARTFGAAPGHPALSVLDSTHPDAVTEAAARLDPERTLFLVSSKSGTTTETSSLFRYFWEKTGGAGRCFAAITDPGTPLERLARERGFRAVFHAPDEVGGRYSALTTFGLVPAALLGIDLRRLLDRARSMAGAYGPGLRLGAALGELARAGRDKLTFLTTPGLASFPAWIEQLVAESTGKHGQGIVPVVGEPPGGLDRYGDDRIFVALLLAGESDAQEERLAALEAAGHPVARFRLSDPYDLGREIFRWEVATAAAGAVLGINPFDQPDVQLAKELAGQAMKERGRGAAPSSSPEAAATDAGALGRALQDWLAGTSAVDYLGIHAYLPASTPVTEALHNMQGTLRDRTRCAVTAGYGPRFLHSTGQLHKGGPAGGRFLQIVDDTGDRVPVPETDYSFGVLVRAQANGDRQALEQRGRKVLRVALGAGVPAVQEGLQTLVSLLAGSAERP